MKVLKPKTKQYVLLKLKKSIKMNKLVKNCKQNLFSNQQLAMKINRGQN